MMKLLIFCILILVPVANSALAGMQYWGGKGVFMVVNDHAADFQFNCRLAVSGQWIEHGGEVYAQGTEIQVGLIPKPVPVVFHAKIHENLMDLTVTYEDHSEQKFEMKFGAKAELHQCLE